MNENSKTPFIPISWGELLDKISILEIKILKITSMNARQNIAKELKYLSDIANLNNTTVKIQTLTVTGSAYAQEPNKINNVFIFKIYII